MNKSKPVRDFISWMLAAPVLLERAVAAIKPLIERHVEFLPLTEIERKPLYAVNVLNVIDCLDTAKSDILFSPSEPGRIVNVFRFVFDPTRLSEDPLIFKVPDDLGCVFVSQTFVNVVISQQLRGSLLLKPNASPFSAVLPASPDVLKPVHTRTSQK
ncbi:MAG: hypothetical protein KIS67_12355 [Verrucomicrobiae bacterium]|nr:hypothetical protein [Verrucomicrobiae bacterium]